MIIENLKKMKRRKLYVEECTDVDCVSRNIIAGFGLDKVAESYINQVEDEVSGELLEMLSFQLLGFCKEMQREMAEDLLFFALGHVAHTTGCPSADYVLDICYTLIAIEHGIKKEEEEEENDEY